MQQQGNLRIGKTGKEIGHQIQDVLPLVTKPNQYLGNELNVCTKEPDQVDLQVVLAFPDTYYIGMSHLGFRILYHILNGRPDVYAERAYAPWVDMEGRMRKRGIPLFSLESHTPLKEFDLLGFTLPYELNFTNVLNMLDLAHIPLRAQDRDERWPLVVAGGSCASNPEPLAEFIDAFVIGDGEEVVLELVDLLIQGKKNRRDRRQTLLALSGIEGVYVPSLYEAQYDREGRFVSLVAADGTAPPRIKARIVDGLHLKNYPQHPMVSLSEIAHDRLSVEIMRGCTRGCRYCHAGMIYRPVREKAPDDILQEVVSGIANSGWDEVSLLSLSSSDYSCLQPVVAEINRLMANKRVALSLPSMRPDSFTRNLARLIQDVRRTGLTLAPEAGTDRLRKVINKSFPEEDLLESLRIAFENGWESVKLYFMIGLPTETWVDLAGIVELGRKVHRLGRQKGKRDLNVSISPFTPKAHTPFQWEKQDDVAVLDKKSRYLKNKLPHRGMRVNWRDPHVSFLEGVFARGDRQLSKVLFLAWQSGCTFDSWSERFRFSRWNEAFSRAGVDPLRYIAERPLEGPLPWGHIDYGVQRSFLMGERKRALRGQLTEDCRYGPCRGCGAHSEGRADRPEPFSLRPLQVNGNPLYGRRRKLRSGGRNQLARARMRIRYAKGHPVRFLSHLDMARLFERGLRRADLPIAYSEGFHPHPKMAFGPPLPVGLTSQAEYLDIQFAKPFVGDVIFKLSSTLPHGVELLECKAIFGKTESLTAAINVAEYRADLQGVGVSHRLTDAVEQLLNSEHLSVHRVTPRESKTVDIREFLLELHLSGSKGDESLEMRLRVGEGGHARPQEVLAMVLDLSEDELLRIPIQRTGQFIERDGWSRSPMDVI